MDCQCDIYSPLFLLQASWGATQAASRDLTQHIVLSGLECIAPPVVIMHRATTSDAATPTFATGPTPSPPPPTPTSTPNPSPSPSPCPSPSPNPTPTDSDSDDYVEKRRKLQ